jgi:murein DD-endopeptidase MepM/ murein hydrolase activator NlpD
VTSAKSKMPRLGPLYYIAYSFLMQYPVWRIALFLLLSNVTLYLTYLCKDLMYVPRQTEFRYESIDIAFRRAMLTIVDSVPQAENTLVQLAHNFRETVNLALTQQSVLQTAVVRADRLDTLPSNIAKQVTVAVKSLKCPPNRNISIQYRNATGVELVALLDKAGQVVRKVKRYKAGFYNEQGVRLDVADRIPNFVRLITPAKDGKARISSGYGNRIHPIYKRKMFHAGVDIVAPLNSRVHAALPGKVHKIGYGRGYGNYVIIQHHDDVQTLYAHLHSISSKMVLGRQVRAGEIIGRVGKTGRATGPHLHFEARIKGKHVNPKSVKPIHPRLSKQENRRLWSS